MTPGAFQSLMASQLSPLPLVATCPRSGPNTVEKHSDLWFIDGSVVLQADKTVFLVHQTQLARHSLIFRDMFSLPQPPAPRSRDDKVARCSPMFEGHPLVIMHDAAEDVANLLTALYDGPFVLTSASAASQYSYICPPHRTFGNNDPADFRIVSGILRLSSKYLIESLRSRALAHLSIAWPATLKGWDAREEAVRTFEYENSHSSVANREHLYPSPIVSSYSPEKDIVTSITVPKPLGRHQPRS